MKDKIIEVIERIRPYINMDGGDIEFIKYEDKYVYVKMYGACQNCALQNNTLNDELLNFIQAEVPEVEGVINVNL